MKADPAGGLSGSTIDFVTVFEKGEIPAAGQFFHLSPSGEVRIIRDDMAGPSRAPAQPAQRSSHIALPLASFALPPRQQGSTK